MMNSKAFSFCTDIGYLSVNKHDEQLCGDHVELVEQDENSIVFVLADGLGSGVKASILSTLTSKIISTMMANNMSVEDCVATMASTLPVCEVRKVAYSTFTIIRVVNNKEAEIIQYDNPQVIMLRDGKNFDYPYVSQSITEFWRRWHISLSSFFRDYLYIPLGGNRRHVVLNLAIVWALTGLWHGASWNFVLWGLYFFVLLVIERFTRKYLEKIPGVLRWAATFLLLVIGWNIFYFTDGTRLLESFRVMLGAAGTGFADEQLRISFINNLPLLILCILGSTPLPQIVGNTFGMLCASKDGGGKKSRIYVAVTYVYDLLLLALCTVALVSSTFNAFLYFRF